MGTTLTSLLVQALLGALGLCAIPAGLWVGAVVRRRVKAAWVRELLATIAEVTGRVVDSYARAVRDLKDPEKPGLWGNLEAAFTKKEATEKALSILGDGVRDYLRATGSSESPEGLVGAMIEAALERRAAAAKTAATPTEVHATVAAAPGSAPLADGFDDSAKTPPSTPRTISGTMAAVTPTLALLALMAALSGCVATASGGYQLSPGAGSAVGVATKVLRWVCGTLAPVALPVLDTAAASAAPAPSSSGGSAAPAAATLTDELLAPRAVPQR